MCDDLHINSLFCRGSSKQLFMYLPTDRRFPVAFANTIQSRNRMTLISLYSHICIYVYVCGRNFTRVDVVMPSLNPHRTNVKARQTDSRIYYSHRNSRTPDPNKSPSRRTTTGSHYTSKIFPMAIENACSQNAWRRADVGRNNLFVFVVVPVP